MLIEATVLAVAKIIGQIYSTKQATSFYNMDVKTENKLVNNLVERTILNTEL